MKEKKLKIGDWVQVVQARSDWRWHKGLDKYVGKTFQILNEYGDGMYRLNGITENFMAEALTPIKRKKHTKFRDKLIISIAGGPIAATYNIYDFEGNAKQIIKFADAIIKQLEDDTSGI